ncbi:hypothetical protein HELRODRAFT_172251 [Helobdella robusta]|uniref:Serine/threonine-protein phosphatase 1 regulatory subunit 10 n=1 Tax=Helobdella robusta TaxID=6412 RepID=T1F560_HELRO|nr:hypothetical protein HELRODRAFT_172251 [Helobdella robusta]ESO04586.1 hypothetical protein HELRODRAFT_172251 [Helobdella robusta]
MDQEFIDLSAAEPLFDSSIEVIECEAEEFVDMANGENEEHADGGFDDSIRHKEVYVKELLENLDNDADGGHSDDGQPCTFHMEKFLANDGWMRCFQWLQTYKKRRRRSSDLDNDDDVDDNDDNNNNNNNDNSSSEFIINLLKLIKKIPVTVDMMKQNGSAKIIKRMIKSTNDEISALSKVIISDWMSKFTANHHHQQQKDSLSPPSSGFTSSSSSCFMSALTSSLSPTFERRKKPKLTNRKREGPNNNNNCNNRTGTEPSNSNNNNSSFDDNDVDETVDNNNNLSRREDEDAKMDTTSTAASAANRLRRSTSSSSSANKRKRKSVKWADDASLCTYFFFQMNESERVNVNKSVDFAETLRHEIEMEHRMFQNARKMFSDENVIVKSQWHRPLYLSGSISLVEPGCNSSQRKIQMIREQNVLQVIYFSRCMIPDHPAEADAEFVDVHEPKIIPLHDTAATTTSAAASAAATAASAAATTATTNTSITTNNTGSNNTTSGIVDVELSPGGNGGGTMQAGLVMPWGPMYPMPNVMAMDGHGMPMPPHPGMMPPMMFPPPPGFPPFPPIPMMRGVMPPMMQYPPGPPKPVCTHYLMGTCKFGLNCRNFHPPPVGQPPIVNHMLAANHKAPFVQPAAIVDQSSNTSNNDIDPSRFS